MAFIGQETVRKQQRQLFMRCVYLRAAVRKYRLGLRVQNEKIENPQTLSEYRSR